MFVLSVWCCSSDGDLFKLKQNLSSDLPWFSLLHYPFIWQLQLIIVFYVAIMSIILCSNLHRFGGSSSHHPLDQQNQRQSQQQQVIRDQTRNKRSLFSWRNHMSWRDSNGIHHLWIRALSLFRSREKGIFEPLFVHNYMSFRRCLHEDFRFFPLLDWYTLTDILCVSHQQLNVTHSL